MREEKPKVSKLVHLIQGGACRAAIITAVSEEQGTGLHVFAPPGAAESGVGSWHPYVGLKSARPTSGWHWPREHDA